MIETTRAARTKLMLALAGGGAVLVMAGLTVVFDDGAQPELPAVAAPILPGPMTVGDTVTTTIAPAVLATEKARVQHKARPYGE